MTDNDDDDLGYDPAEDLIVPAHVRPFVEVLGREKAIELFMKFGGTGIYLAKKPQERLEIGSILSVPQIMALTQVLGSGYHRLPIPKEYLVKYFTLVKGWSVKRIARELHITDMSVYRNKRDKRQMDMF